MITQDVEYQCRLAELTETDGSEQEDKDRDTPLIIGDAITRFHRLRGAVVGSTKDGPHVVRLLFYINITDYIDVRSFNAHAQ